MAAMTAHQLASMLRASAHANGQCICGGRMVYIGIEEDPDTGQLEHVYNMPHRTDCPVLVVFGRNARTQVSREGA